MDSACYFYAGTSSVLSKGGVDMKYEISSECVACGRCFQNCPVGSIYPARDQYQIDPENAWAVASVRPCVP